MRKIIIIKQLSSTQIVGDYTEKFDEISGIALLPVTVNPPAK